MSGKKPKATRKRMISCFAQIVQEHIPGWKIEEIASGEKVKARKFSYSSQVYLLMLSQFLHLFSLNEIVDVSKIILGGAVAGAWHNARESQHVLQREPHARPEGDADVLLDRVRHLPQRGAGLHKRTPPREAIEVQAARHLRRRLDHHPACVLVHRLGEAQAEEGRSEGPHGRERREQATTLLRVRQGRGTPPCKPIRPIWSNVSSSTFPLSPLAHERANRQHPHRFVRRRHKRQPNRANREEGLVSHLSPAQRGIGFLNTQWRVMSVTLSPLMSAKRMSAWTERPGFSRDFIQFGVEQ